MEFRGGERWRWDFWVLRRPDWKSFGSAGKRNGTDAEDDV